MSQILQSWRFWALLSAAFAALTAILAKIGVVGVNPDVATFVRTVVILCLTAVIVAASGEMQGVTAMPVRNAGFLVLSGLATGASWLCYFRALSLGDAARVAPLDKLSVVLVTIFAAVFLGETLSVPNWLGVGLIAVGAVLVAYRG